MSVIYTALMNTLCLYVCVFDYSASGNTRQQQLIRQLVSSTRHEQLVLLSTDLGEMLLPVEISVVCLSVHLSVFVSFLDLHVG